MLFGPYIDLNAGAYEFTMSGRCSPDVATSTASVEIDVVSNGGTKTHWKETFPADLFVDGHFVLGRFDLAASVSQLEVRASVTGDRNWQISLPIIERCS